MAIRQVRTIEDDILRKECKPVKEITPRIAEAIGSAAAKKVLLPVSQNHFEIVGVEPKSLAALVKEAVSRILTLVEA